MKDLNTTVAVWPVTAAALLEMSKLKILLAVAEASPEPEMKGVCIFFPSQNEEEHKEKELIARLYSSAPQLYKAAKMMFAALSDYPEVITLLGEGEGTFEDDWDTLREYIDGETESTETPKVF